MILYLFCCIIFSTNYGARNVLSPSSPGNANGGNQHRRKSAVELTASLKANKSGSPFGEGTKVKHHEIYVIKIQKVKTNIARSTYTFYT